MTNSATTLNWATPIARNANGRFVSLKNIQAAATTAAKTAIKFLSAVYGTTEKSIPVVLTEKSIGHKVTNKLAGSDPCPKVKKQLIVEAEIEGEKVTKTFIEGEKIVF
jgi:hypothetical protein